jgi:hypothetical protein
MIVPPAALATYETLRGEVLRGQARPAGLAAVIYHGMLHGLAVILTNIPATEFSPTPAPGSDIRPLDRELLHLVANMVLQSQAQVSHVY